MDFKVLCRKPQPSLPKGGGGSPTPLGGDGWAGCGKTTENKKRASRRTPSCYGYFHYLIFLFAGVI